MWKVLCSGWLIPQIDQILMGGKIPYRLWRRHALMCSRNVNGWNPTLAGRFTYRIINHLDLYLLHPHGFLHLLSLFSNHLWEDQNCVCVKLWWLDSIIHDLLNFLVFVEFLLVFGYFFLHFRSDPRVNRIFRLMIFELFSWIGIINSVLFSKKVTYTL